MIQAVRGEVRDARVHSHNSGGHITAPHLPVWAGCAGKYRDPARHQPPPHLGSESDTCRLLALSAFAEVTAPLPSTKTVQVAPDMTGDEIKAAALSQRTWQEARSAWNTLVSTNAKRQDTEQSRAGGAPGHRRASAPSPLRSCHVHFRTRDSSGLWGVPTLGPLQAGHR